MPLLRSPVLGCHPALAHVVAHVEGLSKHRESAYGAGRCTHWIKVKNREHPAYRRVQDQCLKTAILSTASSMKMAKSREMDDGKGGEK